MMLTAAQTDDFLGENTPSNPWGDPPALPGRQQKFDRSGSVLHHPCDCDGTVRAAVSRGFGFCL
jgi:hypothetical protein